MKRNLSSQAIRAMAIGMAVTLGSATAVSGVVTGTVVNVYAANFEQSTFAEAKIEKESTDLKITITAAAGKKFSGSGDLTGLVVKTADGSKEVANKSSGVTSIEGGDVAGNKLVIKIPISELSQNTLTGKETSLKITSLKSTSVKYGDASGSQDSLAFDTGDFTLNTNSSNELNIDNTAPTLQGATATYKNESGTTVEITLSNDSLADLSKKSNSNNFTIAPKNSGTSDATVTHFEVKSGKLILTLSKGLSDNTYTVTYAKEDAEIKDAAGNKLTTNGTVDVVVKNTPVDQTAPTITGDAVYDRSAKTITLTASEYLKEYNQTDAGVHKFTVKKDNKEDQKITNVKVEGGNLTKIVITLDKELVDGSYTIGYGGEGIEDKANNKLVKNPNLKILQVSDQADNKPIINNIATYDKSTNTITLTSNKDLKELAVTNINHGFTVTGATSKNVEIENVQIKADSPKSIIIKVKGETLKDDTYTVGYTQSTADISTKDGNVKLDNNANLATFEVKADTVQGDLTATTSAGTYTFKNLDVDKVALVRFATLQTRAAQTNTFENGVLTADGKTYTLTQIGNGTKVDGLTTKALEGHTSNVTTIKENAFNGNTNVTTLTFPNVTNVESNAFKGATALVSIDLGSASKGITVGADVFTGASKLKNIATSTENKDKVYAAIKGSRVQATVITDENSNATNATIASGKFYQTKEGLIFKGIDSTKLSFEGKEKYTAPTEPNGLTGETKEKAYLVTYKDGVVSLKAGEKPPVEESFDVTVKDKKLTFKPLTDNTVALANVGNTSVMRVAAVGNTLKDGVLTVGSKTYNFTQIGDGTTPLATDFDANTVLAGNLDKVTTVAKDAFKDNTALKEISLPKVTTIQEGAFNGTSNLAKVFLGDKVVTVAKDAFKGTKSDIKVSSNNDKTIENLKKPETGLDINKVENAAPFVTSSVVNKDAANKVVVTFSEKVYAPVAITASDFIIEGDGSKLTVNSVEGLQTGKDHTKDTITLTLSGDVKAGEARTLKYTKSSNAIKDINDIEFKDITEGIKITNNLEASVDLPTVQTATVESGAKADIVLTLDKEPTTQLVDGDKNDFKVAVADGKTKDHKVKTVKTSGNKVTITLDKDLASDNTDIKLTYTGNKIKALNNQVVTNNIQPQTVDVKVDSVTVDGVTLKITVNNGKTLKDEPTLGKDSFTVTKGTANTPVDVSSAAVARNVITLTLGAAIEAGDTEIKVEYNGKNTKLVENGTNVPIGSIASQFAVNEKDVTAPTLPDKASVTATTTSPKTGITITLPVSEPIKAKQVNIPVGKFTVTVVGGSKNITVDSVTIGADKKSLVLACTSDNALAESTDKLKVDYTASDEITDLKGNQLEAKAIDNIDITLSRTAAVVAQVDSDMDLVAIAKVNENQEGKVTVVNSFKDTDKDLIQSMLTKDLRKIANNAFKGISNIELDFTNLSSIGVIDNGAFNGASNLTVKYTGSEKEAYELAKKLQNVSDVTLNNKKPSEVIKDYENNNNNGGSGSGGGSSSGGSGGGSGANIGTITNKKPNTEETTSQGNKNETVVENKQLSFDVIKLPSVEGEAKVFGDVSANHWAKSYIDKLSTARIINGSNGMFNPNGQTKRADVTVMLVNLLGLTPEANNKFADVNASAYYAPYVGTASTYGIVNGSNGMFNPQGVISRQDTMVMIAQILKGLNLNVNADTTALSQFGDASKVSAYANESVAILVNSGIIAGNNGKLNPTAPVTRAEMATIMSKLYDVLASANK